MYFSKQDVLFQNYFQFLRFFRGTVRETNDVISVESDKKEFTFSVPLSVAGLSSLLKNEATHTLLVPKELKIDVPDNWKLSGGLTFMETKTAPRKVDTVADTTFGNSENIVRDFSVAQCRGFLDSPEVFEAWSKWLTDANLKNIHNDAVSFYVADQQNKPVAGAINVKTKLCVGIYGVATDPEFRKRGLGTLLLAKILEHSNEGDVVGLQVESQSYAHGYYKKLGFKDTYELLRFKK